MNFRNPMFDKINPIEDLLTSFFRELSTTSHVQSVTSSVLFFIWGPFDITIRL